MNSGLDNLNEIIALWKDVHKISIAKAFSTDLHTKDLIASFFCPGDFYYFILNFQDVSFEYVHQDVQKVIGCLSEEYHFGLIFEKMHPEDVNTIKLKEQAASEFFYHRIPLHKIPFYKSTYTFRIRDDRGGWKNILHQSIALQVSDAGRIQYVLCVHSDITFLNPIADDRISFIGIKGEPSFHVLSTNPKHLLEQPHTEVKISLREREIIELLAKGLSSKQIADILYLSQHTVDTHRRNLLRKTGTKNTLELTALCIKRGLL